MVVALEPIHIESLRLLAGGVEVRFGDLVVAEAGLPPPHVVNRAIRVLSGGCDVLWGAPFNIIDVERRMIVGGCGFKGAPLSGAVEVGYGIAPSCHRLGYAYAGLSQLLPLAASSPLVTEVIALISPGNHASQGLAAKLGFVCRGERRDADGELVQSWHWQGTT